MQLVALAKHGNIEAGGSEAGSRRVDRRESHQARSLVSCSGCSQLQRALLPVSRLQKRRGAIFYCRFRDDVVVILEGWIDSNIPAMFEATLNQCTPEYQAKFSWDTSSIISLDVKISRHGSKLSCETYFKPTSLFRYLRFHSNYSAMVFRSWIGAGIHRYVITNSSLQSFNDTIERRPKPL